VKGARGLLVGRDGSHVRGFFGLEANQFNKKEVSKGGRGRKRISKQQQRREIKTCLGDLGERCACQARKAAKEAKCAGR
jgi:hypothetical protein